MNRSREIRKTSKSSILIQAPSTVFLLILQTVFLLQSTISHVHAAEVVTQSSGEKLTGSACRILESRYVSKAISAETSSAGSAYGRPGIIMEASWLHKGERHDLPLLLTYLGAMGARATLELPATRFNDEPMALFEAFGGMLLERELSEPVGVTRSIAEALDRFPGSFLLLDDFIPLHGQSVRRKFQVGAADTAILLTILITDPHGAVSVIAPDGMPRKATRRTAKAIQWEIESPVIGEWKIEIKDTIRTRIHVQTSANVMAPRIPTCHLPGEIRTGANVEGTWRLDRMTPDGLRFANQGMAGAPISVAESGVYSLTWKIQESGVTRISRRGIYSGHPRPLFFRQAPCGKLSQRAPLRVALLGMNLPDTFSVATRIGSTACQGKVTSCGHLDGVGARDVQFDEAVPLTEGRHTASVRIATDAGIVEDSWTFTLDLAQPTELRLSEIHPRDGWFEVEAISNIADLSNYGVTDLDSGFSALPAVPLVAGARLAIQAEVSAKGNFGFPIRTIGLSSRDELVLVAGTPKDFAVIDAVIYDGSEDASLPWSEDEQTDMEFLVSRKEWNGAPILLPGAHASLARTSLLDQHSAGDWMTQPYPSPGQPQATERSSVEVTAANVELSEVGLWGTGSAWAEIRVKQGPIDLSTLSIGNFNGDDLRLGSAPRVARTGEHIVIRWGGKAASDKDILLNGNPPNRVADQAALIWGRNVIDAVAWKEEGATVSPDESKDQTRHDLFPVTRPDFIRGTQNIPTLARVIGAGTWAWAHIPTPGEANTQPVPPPAGSIRIAAVSPCEFSGDWAELICLQGPADISSCILTDLDGDDAFLSKIPLTLQRGETVVVRWGDGRTEADGVGDLDHNGVRDVYLSRRDSLGSTDDQLALVYGDRIQDAVAFTNGDGTISKDEQKDMKYLIDRLAWTGAATQSSAVNVGTYRLPIERKPGSSYSPGREDWVVRSPDK